MKAEIVILGSGTSMGVPTLGCQCRVCTSDDPRDRRMRPSAAILWPEHSVLIDTGPDFREQALREELGRPDAVFYTHSHADHILGLDDLRPLSFKSTTKIPLYADEQSATVIERVFDYTFSPESQYPTRARVELHRMQPAVNVHGLVIQRVPLIHGDIEVSGFRFGSAAYLTDMNAIPPDSFSLLENLDVLVLDALRIQPHPSHSNLEQALEFVRTIRPGHAYFTHMSHEVHHADTERELPDHVSLSFDGLRIPFEF